MARTNNPAHPFILNQTARTNPRPSLLFLCYLRLPHILRSPAPADPLLPHGRDRGLPPPMIPSDGGADPSLALDAVTSGRGAPGHAFPSTVSPGCLRSSGSAAPVRRSPPARAQSMPTCTRKGRRQEQSCKDRTSRPVNRAILLRLGRHVPHPRRRPLWRSPPG